MHRPRNPARHQNTAVMSTASSASPAVRSRAAKRWRRAPAALLASPRKPGRAAQGTVLGVSQGRPVARDPCPPPVPGVAVICFNPSPATTQGEAEFVGRLARKHHWHSVAVVAITPQDSRTRLRVGRCFPGQVYVVTAPIRPSTWPYQIAYEWAALIKALVIQLGW